VQIGRYYTGRKNPAVAPREKENVVWKHFPGPGDTLEVVVRPPDFMKQINKIPIIHFIENDK
jgi:hypothetical protein